MAMLLSPEQRMLADSARDFLGAKSPVARLRALRDADDATGYDPSLWQSFAQMGFAGLAVPDAHGGLGLGQVEAGIVLEEIGRNLSPSVAALSARASDMSGWLLLGLPGALYVTGLVEAWIGIGLFLGALVNWIVVAPRLRRQTEELGNALTIPEFLANRFPSHAIALRLTSAVIVVAFFTVYTAAGMVGGG